MKIRRTVDFDDTMYDKLAFVSGAFRLSIAEFIRVSLAATLTTIAAEDKLLAAGMKFIEADDKPRMPKRVKL